jgi:hypothetical protein
MKLRKPHFQIRERKTLFTSVSHIIFFLAPPLEFCATFIAHFCTQDNTTNRQQITVKLEDNKVPTAMVETANICDILALSLLTLGFWCSFATLMKQMTAVKYLCSYVLKEEAQDLTLWRIQF